MEFLGEVETITDEGRLIVRATALPDVNSPVFDQRERKIGTVKRVFGPVDSPYVTILPVDKERLSSLAHKKIYFKGENTNGKGKRRN